MTAETGNPVLRALIRGAGFSSLERFATAVNQRGWDMLGINLSYDHVSVKRWLGGGVCQNADVVADVLATAWGVPVPVQVIWPGLREGLPAVPPHLQPWVAARTVEELAFWVRSDMLTRRGVLTQAVGVATGSAFIDPIVRWLNIPAVGPIGSIGADTGTGSGVPNRIGLADVAEIERGTQYFKDTDARVGGGLVREAAVGQLKYAVDLMQHANYTEAVGHRLLAAIADLSGRVGWMCHDVGMEGPAQRYLTYGLQAAHESRHEHAHLLAAKALTTLSLQSFLVNGPSHDVLRLLDLAFDQLPRDGRKLNKIRALLWSYRAMGLAGMGSGYTAEARSAVGLSFDLYGQLGDEDQEPAVTAYFRNTNDAEIAHAAAVSYRHLSGYDRKRAAEAERQARYALDHRPSGFERSRAFDQIELARARFAGGEPDQACEDGEAAIELAGRVTASKQLLNRLRQLSADADVYQDQPRVREFQERARLAITSGDSNPAQTA